MIRLDAGERWAVIGGGFSGMTVALRLAQQGKAVTLFEAASSLGGLASAWQLGEVVWDRHYHVTLFSDIHLRSLLTELDLEDEMQWKTTRTGFYVNAQFYSMSNVFEFFRFTPLSLLEKIRLGATILRASRIKNWKFLEKVYVKDWLQRWSGARVVEKIWLPLLRAKLGESYTETSAAFIWATIARMYAARRTGMKTELFGYVPGGYARIVQRFEQVLRQNGIQCRLGQPVKSITSAGLNEVTIELENGHSETLNQAVVTTSAPYAVKLCPQLTTAEKTQLKSIKYQGIICASLLLKQPLSSFYITNLVDNGLPFTAVIEMSALVDRKHFGGGTIVYLPKYVASDSTDFAQTDETVQKTFLEALERMYPQFKREDLLCFKISRIKYLLPIPTLSYSAHLPKMTTSIDGLHMVNSAQIMNGTLNVNETIQLAEAACRRLATNRTANALCAEFPEYEITETHR